MSFSNDLFSFIQETEVCNFADDNTFHSNGFFLHAVISALKKGSENALKWLKINYMAANPAKFQIMFLGMPEEREIIIDISGVALKSSPADKLLGVFLDRKLNFKTHIQSLCKTASQKIKALFRIRPYLNFRCAKHLCEGYILSTFNYCPLIWMFSSKANDGLINIYTSWDQTCSYETGLLPESQRAAIIRCLPKKGDHADVRNWRPISLLNADYKIFAKCITNRLATFLPFVISPHQTANVKSRKIQHNLRLLRDFVFLAYQQASASRVCWLFWGASLREPLRGRPGARSLDYPVWAKTQDTHIATVRDLAYGVAPGFMLAKAIAEEHNLEGVPFKKSKLS